jgi:sulfite reductase (ferredoxin)
VGRVNGGLLHVIADLAEEYGSGRVRTTTEQKMVILDVPADRTEALAAELEGHDLQVRPSTFRRQTMACTGIEFCKLAIVETKQRGMDLIGELERRLPDFDEPLTININGCPNSCTRIQVADIGLKGQLVTDSAGNQVEGYQVHLGGSVGGSFGKKIRGLKTTADELPDYVERVLRRFQEQKTGGEPFTEWVQRADESDLK